MRTRTGPGRLLPLLFILFLPTLCAAAPEVRVINTHPEVATPLGAGQALYLQLVYDSDQPLRFQTTAASERGLMMNPSPVYPAGQGEAIVWLAYRQATRLDTVGIRVFDASWRELARLDIDMPVRWTATVTDTPPHPAWVERLSGEQQTRVSAGMSAGHEGDATDSLLVMLMGWSIPGYFLLQWLVWRRWRNRWRRAGLLPLWVAVPLIGWSAFALLAGSNLWPLAMLFIVPLLFGYLLVLFLIHAFSGHHKNIKPHQQDRELP